MYRLRAWLASWSRILRRVAEQHPAIISITGWPALAGQSAEQHRRRRTDRDADDRPDGHAGA
jgi:hypothetical protein